MIPLPWSRHPGYQDRVLVSREGEVLPRARAPYATRPPPGFSRVCLVCIYVSVKKFTGFRVSDSRTPIHDSGKRKQGKLDGGTGDGATPLCERK